MIGGNTSALTTNRAFGGSFWDGGGGGFAGLSAGGWLQAGGSVIGAIGAYHEAESRKSDLKSRALDLEHESAMSAINARLAEADAVAIEQAGRDEADRVALQYAREKAGYRARTAGSGIVLGVGSTAEAGASIDLAAELDRLTINTNTAREAGHRRMQATDIRNRGSLASVSARNTRDSASSIYPLLVGGGHLLSTGGQFLASQERRRVR